MLSLFASLLAAASFFTALPTPSASFDYGTIHVDRYGGGGKAIVFIPGLGCGPWSWSEQIARFSKTNTVYALTLDGFDGRPFVESPDPLAAFDRDFWSFAAAQHVSKPVVIGHSLGGTLGFALAESHPERLAGVIALDGLPVFPMLAQSTDAQRTAAAGQMRAIAAESRDQVLAYERGFMKQIGTTHDDLVEPLAQAAAKSDPRAIAAWGAADLAADLRPGLAKASLPIEELMPYAQPTPYTEAQTLAFYRMLLDGAPSASVVPIDGARHFAMIDQPQAVDDAITQFLVSK